MANKLNKNVRFSTKLSNGQFAYIEFSLGKFGNGMYYYDTAFIIADNPKTCRYWLLGKKNEAVKQGKNIQTGRAGLEGLIWAKDVVQYFVDEYLPKGVMLMVRGSDDKRYHAYNRYLTKKMQVFEQYKWGDEDHLAYIKQ